ncbi:hypothetical protein [Salinisphaera orenii]|uniref:hypothetical protein n=1 Tax=Salinisphaera orenii TaxID=856731 RepID=UPI000DBE4B2A
MSQRDHIWRLIRAGDVFTIAGLIESTGYSSSNVRPYVNGLAKNGVLERIDPRPGKPTHFRLADDPGPQAPRYDGGKGQVMTRPTERYRIWQSVRVLRVFGSADVAATAESTKTSVNAYIRDLCHAGYARMTRSTDHSRGNQCEYRLIRDPGPLPLRYRVSDSALIDPNTGEVFPT